MSKTKAIILAGGFGTRLQPLTCTVPKPMCKILNKPVLERILDNLQTLEIDEAIISTMYKSEYITSRIGSRFGKTTIKYVKETEPLGSAGGARLAFTKLNTSGDDNVLVLSGDGIFDFDISDALKFHNDKNAEVTIITRSEANPLQYGVVNTDKNGKILELVEKPSWNKVRSDTINTGIYIINEKVFKLIPQNIQFDFSKDLFPHLLANNMPVYSYNEKGYWCDIGDISSYYRCNIDALKGKIKNFNRNNTFNPTDNNSSYISDSAFISTLSRLEGNNIICDNVYIEDDAHIVSSVICDGAKIEKNAVIINSIICEKCVIKEGTFISGGCVIGAETTIEENVTVNQNIKIWPYKTIKKGFFVTQDVTFENNCLNIYNEEGYSAGKSSERINVSYIIRLGNAFAEALNKVAQATRGYKSKIGVMHNGDSDCSLIADTLLCSIKNSGLQTYSFSSGFEAQALFAANEYMMDIVLYVTVVNEERIIKLYRSASSIAADDFERTVESEYKFSGTNSYKCTTETINIDCLQFLYRNELEKIIRNNKALSNIEAVCSDDDCNGANKIICELLDLNNIATNQYKENSIKYNISPDGMEATLEQYTDERHVYFDTFHIRAVILLYQDKYFKNAVNSSSNTSDIIVKLKSDKNIDMCMAIIKLFVIMSSENKTLHDLYYELPGFEIDIKELTTELLGKEKRAVVMKKLYENYKEILDNSNTEGINLRFDNGNITVVPRRTGGFRIITEANNSENVKAIYDRIEKEIFEI